MSELHLPLDFEQLAEIASLRSQLRVLHTQANPAEAVQAAEREALFLLLRLFRVLGYLARTTNQPGRLTASGVVQFRNSLEPAYGDNVDPVRLLVDCQLLVPVDGEWYCPIFAQHNPHLAANYEAPHQKGNTMRQVSLAMRAAAAAVPHQQGTLLLPEVYRRRDGTPLEPKECEQVLLLVGTLDRIFRFERKPTQYTERLFAAAAEIPPAVGKHADVEKMRTFYHWLYLNRTHPIVPKTAEEIINDWPRFYKMSLAQSAA